MQREEFLKKLVELAAEASCSEDPQVKVAAGVLYGHVSALTMGGEILSYYVEGTKALVERNNTKLDEMISTS